METYWTTPDAIHETVDGETIVIDLATGTYYSLRGSAPEIWSALTGGATVESAVAYLRTLYDTPPDDLSEAVQAFFGKLETERLIAPGAGTSAPARMNGAPHGRPFEQPQLEKYEDLQDIILLDPVHKVDDRGWPHAAPVAGESA